MATEEKHINNLTKLCRICGNLLQKDKFEVLRYKDLVHSVFFVDITKEDSENIHPKYICLRCYSSMRQVKARGTTNSLKIKNWVPHKDSSNCEVCQSTPMLQKGGRKKKKTKSGRPTRSTWNRAIINKINDDTPPDIISKKKKRKSGRPTRSTWNRVIINKINDDTPPDIISKEK